MKRARLNTPLKQVMEAEGRTQAWLARTLDVRPEQVWGWIHGLHIPNEPTRDLIADALGRDVDELWPPVDDRAAA